ncbi:MAG TPA: hypothetical protein VMX94_02895 [Armatimonadota bacterium]|nr:hypothetical protein [Armatimonadota bacterium]HUW30830.1 hypothetical protein [Planctomycetota bacterium]
MVRRITVDLFAEDRAHEDFLKAIIGRIAREHNTEPDLHIGSARGGHARAIDELKSYQEAKLKVGGGRLPDILVAAIDANCKPFTKAKKDIAESLLPEFAPNAVIACPEPHIERWFMADPASFKQVVGASPTLVRYKCNRDRYKSLLADTVARGGQPPLLGGIEFARELVEAMDLRRVSGTEKSLHAFINAMTARLKSL